MVIHQRGGRRGAPRRLVLLGLVGVVIVAGALFDMAAFDAAPAAAHGARSNGCTGVPDRGYGFDFHSTCDRHDRCYRSQPYGSSSVGRRRCDRDFRARMQRHCDRHQARSLRRAACRSVARAYYLGVRSLGWPFWTHERPTPIA